MRRLIPLLFAAICSAGFAAPAGDRDFAPYLQASKSLQAMPELPRLAQPQGAAVLAVLGDSARFLNGAPFTLADMEPLMEACSSSNKIGMSYMLHGLKQAMAGINPQDIAAITQAVQATATRNILSFQDEVALIMPFTFRCLARQLPLIEEFITSLPPEQMTDVRRGGLRKVQNGVLTSYTGYFQALGEQGVSEPNLRRLSGAMAETALTFASALQLPQRRQLHDLAIASKARVPAALSDDLDAIAEAMADQRCGKMCGL